MSNGSAVAADLSKTIDYSKSEFLKGIGENHNKAFTKNANKFYQPNDQQQAQPYQEPDYQWLREQGSHELQAGQSIASKRISINVDN